MKYFSLRDLAKLKNLHFVAKKVVEGFLYGYHRSPYSGVNVEFSEYRPYTFGDELKNIDWKLWAKTDRLYVKKFEEETNMRVWLLLDSSLSMRFPEDENEISKLMYSKILAASLSYVFLNQQDSVGILDFDSKLHNIIPPALKRGQFSRIIKNLDKIESRGSTDIDKAFHELSYFIKRRGLIIIFSDFLTNKDHLKKALSYFKHKKNDVIVFHIYHKEEKELSYEGDSIFIDPETHERIYENPDKIRKEYIRLYQNNIDTIKDICFENKIGFHSISTHEDPVSVLGKVLKR
ncbi:MAG: DUF58 domain-containing protein [Candidatus Muiribacterium halophilum]|mgnify:CR=1 FL=1|uniref:DUF58 domain-containing protein n=1 Tax=Muiribacterium halophilum TaxID=2053465 RepID=A0A2N5ZK82_MUIH1|nr:MAG: DUF58 domain-containing protein [Candidatus Muirbacterium halophilum]